MHGKHRGVAYDKTPLKNPGRVWNKFFISIKKFLEHRYDDDSIFLYVEKVMSYDLIPSVLCVKKKEINKNQYLYM